MSIARVAATLALAGAIVLAAVVLVGGTETRPYTLLFDSAGQLVKGNEVLVAGRPAGTVEDIELTDDNQARIEIAVQEPYAPLGRGTTAGIRATSLSGVANRYVSLDLAPPGAEALEDGATLRQDSTRAIVDLDQLFNTLDPDAREDLTAIVRGFERQLRGKGAEAGEAAEYFNPLLSTSRRLVGELTEDEAALTRFIVNTGQAMNAVAERRDDLADLVGNANETSAAIAAESASLERALQVLPSTLRRGNTTFVNLRATLDDLDPLVAESKPATRELAPLLRELRPLVADARPTVRDLRLLVRRPGADNDAVEAIRKAPRLQRVATPAFANSRRALRRLQPVIEFIRPYTPDLVGWFRDFGQGASGYDANGHYARIQPMFNAFQLTDNPAGSVFTPLLPSQRFDGLVTGQLERCPGAATQPARDGSTPWTDDGNLADGECDPSQVPPGP